MNDLGPVNDIFGINIKREGSIGKMRLTQWRYIADTLRKFKMENCKPVSTPFEHNQKITKNMKSNTEKEKLDIKHKSYRELTGNLIYLANATRLNIAFAANVLSRFCTNPKEAH